MDGCADWYFFISFIADENTFLTQTSMYFGLKHKQTNVRMYEGKKQAFAIK